MSSRIGVVVVVVALLVGSGMAYNNGVGARPPMGWDTWCTDDICGIIDNCTDSEVRSVAHAMYSNGMKELGYDHIILDDCWANKTRNETGHLTPNKDQFPYGMKNLADYIHSLGFKMGVYTCIGTQTCHGGRPGSFGHWQQDADSFASWGLDYVKADYCSKPSGWSARDLYGNLSAALNATGRPIMFALCNWGDEDVVEWGHEVGQTLRVQMDHLPFYNWPFHTGSGKGTGEGVLNIINYMGTLPPSKYVRQYGWLDPDFLETLFPVTMDFTASRTEYTFWSMWSAPLLVSTDIRNMTEAKKSIVMNPEVIAINQDPSNTAADPLYNTTEGGQVWARPLFNGDKAVVFWNPGNGLDDDKLPHMNISIKWSDLGWDDATPVLVRDLWEREDVGKFTNGIQKEVAPRDVFLFRATQGGK